MAKKLKVDDQLLQDFVEGRLDPSLTRKVEAFLVKHPQLQKRIDSIRQSSAEDERQHTRMADGSSSHVQAPPKSSATKKKRRSKPGSKPDLSDVPTELARWDEYEVLRELGRGGMGVVYLARNVAMDRREVLKVLNPSLYSKDSAKQRFTNEIQSGGKLNHPAVVTFYRVLPLAKQLAFAMEYVQGDSLHHYVKDHHPVPIDVACSLGQQIAAALQHAHENGLVHRDLKPANVMVFMQDGELRVKVLDFGLAKAINAVADSGLTQDGATLGTPAYMAPEQIVNAASADIRSDIYGLGCTLYHLLAGIPPFMGTPYEIMMAQTQRNAAPVNLVRPDVPEELALVVARMMEKDPADRYQTPREAQQALRSLAIAPSQITPYPADNPQNETPGSGFESSSAALSLGSHDSVPPSGHPSTAGAYATAVGAPYAVPQSESEEIELPWHQRLSRKLAEYAAVVGMLVVVLIIGIVWMVVGNAAPGGQLVLRNLPPDAYVQIDSAPMTAITEASDGEATVWLEPGKRLVRVYSKMRVVDSQSISIAQGQTYYLDVAPVSEIDDAEPPSLNTASSPTRSEPTVIAPATELVSPGAKGPADTNPFAKKSSSPLRPVLRSTLSFPSAEIRAPVDDSWTVIFENGELTPGTSVLVDADGHEADASGKIHLLTGVDNGDRLLLTNQNLRDVHVRVVYRALMPNRKASLLLGCLDRQLNVANGYSLPLVGREVGSVNQWSEKPLEERSLGQLVEFPVSLHDLHTADVIHIGNQYQFWFDQQNMFTFEDRRFSAGRLGIYREAGIEILSLQYRPLSASKYSSLITTAKQESISPGDIRSMPDSSGDRSGSSNEGPDIEFTELELEDSPEISTITRVLESRVRKYHGQLVSYLRDVERYFQSQENQARRINSDKKLEDVLEERTTFAKTAALSKSASQAFGRPLPDIGSMIQACETAIDAYIQQGALNRANKLKREVQDFKSNYPVKLLDPWLGPELLGNGDCETVGYSNSPGWEGGIGNWRFERHQHVSDLGKHYLLADENADADWSQTVDLDEAMGPEPYEGKWLLLTGMVKNDFDSHVDASLKIQFLDESKTQTILSYENEPARNGTWCPTVLLTAVPENARYARVHMISKRKRKSSYYARFDNISLRPVASP